MPFGWQGRRGRGGQHGISPKPSRSFWKQGPWLDVGWQTFTSALPIQTMSWLVRTVRTVMCTLHICHFCKCPGSCSTPSILPYILLSLTLFELCYTWNGEVVSSVISDACTSRIPSSHGCIQRLPLKVQVREWAELLCRLRSEFLEIAISNGCST